MDGIKSNPIIKSGRIVQLKVSYNKRVEKSKSGLVYDCSITFYDSLLLIPASLSKLATAFNLPQQKGFFPLKVLNNKEYDYEYKGVLPSIENFYHPDPALQPKQYKVFLKEYINFQKQFEDGSWVLKDELIKYCELDTYVLREVILAFTEKIWDLFQINIQGYPTLPSTTLAIFRSNFLEGDDLICKVGGEMYRDIKNGYYGGFVDSYKPHARNVNSYDVNSLYPASMLKFPMTVGKPIKFEGNPDNVKDLFGFVYADVTCPLHIKTPIIPYKVRSKTGGIINVIYPVGS